MFNFFECKANLFLPQYSQNSKFDLEMLMNAPNKGTNMEWEDIIFGASDDQRWMTDVSRDYVSRVLSF